jgi:histone H3/H4
MAQQRKTSIIPKAPAARILMNAGAKRVSADAAAVFSEVIYDTAFKIAEQAARVAKHSGRKTILEEDVKLAAKQ